MPIEIRELEIKASLVDTEGGDNNGSCAIEKEEIIEECLDRIFQILKDKNEL